MSPKAILVVLLAALIIVGCTAAPTVVPSPYPTYTIYPTYTPQATYTDYPTLTPAPTIAIIVTTTETPTPLYTTTETAIPTETPIPSSTDDPLYTPKVPGVYLVNIDIAPGIWRSLGGYSEKCYWEITTETGKIIENYLGLAGGTIYIPATAFQVQLDPECGIWVFLKKH